MPGFIAGTATPDTTPGSFVGSGMALRMANALYPLLEALASAQLASAGLDGVDTTLSDSAKSSIAATAAAWATGIATGVSDELHANAVTKVTTERLGRVPSGGVGADIDPPAAEVVLPLF